MAKCTEYTETKTTTTYHLELTPDEAEVLAFVLERIGGSTETTPRGHTNKIARALETCEVYPGNHHTDTRFPAIYFLGD